MAAAPTIHSKIGDTGRITNMGRQQEARDLALDLRAVRCRPASCICEERTVGPSLGADSIRAGIYCAGIAGVIAVVARDADVLQASGINATLALVLNALILIAALATSTRC